MTALVGPYLVDWTAYRDSFEREASRQLALPVRVAGNATVRLLPTPVVTFEDVRLGETETPAVVVERFRVELDPGSLVKGEINVVHMTIERPSFVIDVGTLGMPEEDRGMTFPLSADKISLADVEIVKGEALVFDSRVKRQWSVSGINAVISAQSLQGPGKIEGGMEFGGEPLSVRLLAGRLADSKVPLKVTVAPVNRPFTVSADGQLILGAGKPAAYEGTFALEGEQHARPRSPDANAARAAQSSSLAALRAEGQFMLSPARLAMPELKLAYGPAERPMQLAGTASFDLGAEARFDTVLNARQIDLDRTLGGGPEKPVLPSALPGTFATALAAFPAPSVPGALRLSAQGVVVGGSIIQDTELDMRAENGAWRVADLSTTLPGATRLELAGAVGVAEGLTFEGRGRLASGRPLSFARWLRGTARRAERLDAFDIAAGLSLAPDRIALTDIVAKVEGGIVRGSLTTGRAEGSNERNVALALVADRLDLDEGWALIELFGGAELAERADRMDLDLAADELTASGVSARSLALNGTLTGDGFELEKLSVADLAGARIEAKGRISDPLGHPKGRLEASVRAEDVSGAARFLAGLLPESEAVRHLEALAPALSPFDADLTFSAAPGGDDLAMTLAGIFAGTSVNLEATGRGPLNKPSAFDGRMKGIISAADTSVFLSQLGFAVTPLGDAGPARVELGLEGSLDRGVNVALDTDLAGTRFALSGDLATKAGAPTLIGELKVAARDIDPLLLLAGVAVPGIGEGHQLALSGDVVAEGSRATLMLREASFDEAPVRGALEVTLGAPVKVSGELALKSVSVPLFASFATGSLPEPAEGRWPDAPLTPALPSNLALDLALEAEQIRLAGETSARNAVFDFSYDGGGARVDGLEADYAGGRLRGAASALWGDAGVSLEVRASLSDAALEELIWQREGRAVARGTADLSFEVAGQGHSVSGIVSTLSGSGSFTAEDGLVRFVNPAAFSSIIRAADSGLKLETESVRGVFSGHLDAGTLAFQRAAGSFDVTSGVMRFSTLSLDAPSATVMGSSTIDLNRLDLKSDWSLKVDPGEEKVAGAEPQVGIVFSGPIAAPGRNIDVTPLLGYLTVRAFEREVEQIEKLQADILEKERFLRRIRLQRQEADRREREAEAEQARARAEAAAQALEDEAEPSPLPIVPGRTEGLGIGGPLPLLPATAAPVRQVAPIVAQ